MNVVLHEAERCQNELAACKASWFSDKRFQIILKWMEVFHSRKKEEEQRQRDIEEQERLIPYPEEGDGMEPCTQAQFHR